MRNLKRVLSLALAVVMVIGMMVMGAGAADIVDMDEVKYVEAVDVMNALGILEGDENGVFNPTGILTREQAAKIICYMLMGPANAEMLNGTAAFSDVEADRWSAPFIGYCNSLGIIAGYDGYFDPTGELTGVAFAKLLLVALGYDAEVEGYVNNKNWATNIGTDAVDAGINIYGVDMDDALTREQAAQMALNAICTPLVEYETKGTNISVNGAEIAFGASKANYVTTTLAKEQRISTQTLTNSNNYTVEFGEKYFPNLTVVATYDAMARPAHEWMIKNESVGLYADEADYAGYVAGKNFTVAKVVESFSKRFDYSKADTFVNGIDVTDNTVAGTVAAATQNKLGNYVEIYMNADDATLVDRICITHKTVNTASVVSTSVAGETTYVTVGGDIGTVEEKYIDGWEKIVSRSIFMYHQDNAGVYHITIPESFNGTMTASADDKGANSYTNPSNFTIEGEVYELSGQTGTILATSLVALKSDTTATYWLDEAGYIVWGKGTPAPTNLLMVLKNNTFEKGNVFKGDTIESQVLFVDENGKTEIVDIAKVVGITTLSKTAFPVQLDDDTADLTTPDFVDNVNNENSTLYSYTTNKAGAYELNALKGSLIADIDTDYDDNDVTAQIVKGIPSAFTTDYADQAITDSKTVYLVRDKATFNYEGEYKDTYTVYTGYANVPSMDIYDCGAIVYSEYGTAKYVVINDYKFAGAQVADDIYVLDNEITANYDAKGDVDYFTVSAIVDGAKGTVKIAYGADVQDCDGNTGTVLNNLNKVIKDHTLYIIGSYDEDGYVDTMIEAVSSASGTDNGTYYWVGMKGSEAAKNDKIVLGENQGDGTYVDRSFAYADDCVVYTISEQRDIVTKGGIDTLTDDDNDKISVIVAGDEYGKAPNNTVVEIYVWKVKNTGDSTNMVLNPGENPTTGVVNAGLATVTVNYVKQATTAGDSIALRTAAADALMAAGYTVTKWTSDTAVTATKDGAYVDFTVAATVYYTITVNGVVTEYVKTGEDSKLLLKDIKGNGTGYTQDGAYAAYVTTGTTAALASAGANTVIVTGQITGLPTTITATENDTVYGGTVTVTTSYGTATEAAANSTVTITVALAQDADASGDVKVTVAGTDAAGALTASAAQTVAEESLEAADGVTLTFTVKLGQKDVTEITVTLADAE